MKYQFLDSGNGEKLEAFGSYILIRPCPQAVWKPLLPEKEWKSAHARFTRDPQGRWSYMKDLPKEWQLSLEDIRFHIRPTDFGHLGLFPEHSHLWKWMQTKVESCNYKPKILNLFAYSGGATLALAKAGAEVCHVDASKAVLTWARENADLNRLNSSPIRWIIDDVHKFLAREIRRGVRYDGILLDPPSFGRGSRGEVFKIEEDLFSLLEKCRDLLSDRALFLILSGHTNGFTPTVMGHLLRQVMGKGSIETGELELIGKDTFPLPCGNYARWLS